MIGRLISHYKILEKLGGGGMGVVYEAEDTKLKRHVALKFLPAELTRDPEAKARFIHEAQSASALQDSNICTIHEIDETEDGQIFICMDYYHGETLKKKIEHGPLKINDAVNIAAQIARGLTSAHEARMIHRDIKPANVMITDKGEVKIVDFGLAKLKGQTRITMKGTTLGTVAYMSPEQVKGEEVDHRSDIWSLGVVLYEILTGLLPFKGDYEQAVMYSILNENPQPLTALRTGIPMELERIVNKMLAKKPDERYQHADEILVDLRQIQSLQETSGKVQISKSEITKDQKPKLKKYVLSSVSVLLIILAYFFLKPLFEEIAIAEPKPVVVISFKNLTGDHSFDYLQEALPNLLITSLEQSKHLRVVSWERIYDLLKQMGKQDVGVIDQETGFEICRLEGVEAIILGSYVKAGDVFATDVKVLDVQSKQLIKSASSKGEGVGSILQNQIDDLSRQISQSIGISENRITSTRLRIADVTTGSMEAYHNFIKGQDAFDKMYYADAKKYLERAIEIDSTFALAYLYLARVNVLLNEDEAAYLNYEKAKMYSGRAGEKDRLYIEAYYARFIEKNPEKRLMILQQIADKYPKEKRIYFDLGVYYHEQKDYQNSIDAHNRALQLDPTYGSSLNDLAYVYGNMGEFDKADEYLKEYTDALPGDANPFDSYGELYLRTGQFEKAVEKYKEAIEVKPDFGSEWRLAWICSFQEDYKTALEWNDRFIKRARSPGILMEGYWWKCLFSHLSGNPGKSSNSLAKCMEYIREGKSHGGWTSLLAAWILMDQGDINQGNEHNTKLYKIRIMDSPQYKANHQADQAFYRGLVYLLQSETDSARQELRNLQQLFAHLTPMVQERCQYYKEFLYTQILVAADSLEAAELVNRAMKPLATPFSFNLNWLIYNFPLSKDGLAQVYQRHGKLDRAIEEYKKLTDLDHKKYGIRLINPKYYYRLAKLYEQKGQKEEAIRQYQKFLDIWVEAEKDLPEYIDATNRLKTLTH